MSKKEHNINTTQTSRPRINNTSTTTQRYNEVKYPIIETMARIHKTFNFFSRHFKEDVYSVSESKLA